jgi:ligand-binding sensor domain-containing protein
MRLIEATVGIALCAAVSAAPAAAVPSRPIRFDRLSLEQGLSQSTVMDVLQDRRGYIWLATEDGLNRHDGHSFKVYRHDPADAASLPSSFVWDIEEDASGDLWVATSSGVARLERATERVIRQDELPVHHARALRFSAKDNVLWVGTREEGVLRLEVASGQWRRFTHDDADPRSLASDRVYALLLDTKGRLWAGTDGGLDVLEEDGKGFRHFSTGPSELSE